MNGGAAANAKSKTVLAPPMRLILAALLVGATLAGCADPAPAPEEAPEAPGPAPAGDVLLGEAFHNATGTITSLPIAVEVHGGGFEVLPNTARIDATLLWSDPVAELSLELAAENGSADGHAGGTFPASDEGTAVADIPGPALGAWSYTIHAENAVDVEWRLVVRMATDVNVSRVISDTVTIAAGQFFEINTVMPEDGKLSWDWTSSETSDFNVHTHFDDEVQYLVEESATAHSGHVVADREGGYSLMWENPGAAPLSLTYTAWGAFEVDSYFPPR